MPTRAKKPCGRPGCPSLTDKRYCDEHQSAAQAGYGRQSAAKRGYDRKWRAIRAMFLRRYPLCADPFGDHEKDGRVIPALDVHHIRAIRDGGTHKFDNLQALCHSCHSRVTASEGKGGSNPWGPGGRRPRAGKTFSPASYIGSPSDEEQRP